MARYTGPVCRLCRREGRKLHLKGDRCNSPKCAFTKKGYPPGERGAGGQRQGKVSTYGLQLRAKEQAKRTYGVLERQFRRYFQIADRTPGITGTVLLQLLERRLDNIVYRLGLASSRAGARQLVTHGHVLVNGRRVDIASSLVKAGETISLSPKLKENPYVASAQAYADTVGRLEWLEWDSETKQGRLLRIPDRDQIPSDLKEQLIVELYSK
ncbi:30S ribosomal protein S4 [Candidatus Sumerlaeota bacterium]|nr:30S ribosomal protein S4 [Candidatus Sumerlaeota bacterium]